MLSTICFIIASELGFLKFSCAPQTLVFTGIPTYQLTAELSTALLAALYAYQRRFDESSITFVGGNTPSIVDFTVAIVWFAVACMITLDLVSGAFAKVGDNLSTTQSGGIEIWQFFVLSINTFHPSSAATDEIVAGTLDALKFVDATNTAPAIIAAATNKISFAFMISPLSARMPR